MNYVGLKCPVCGKAFSADDDIVVCPQCGAPYHRECYAHEGKCVYSDRHGSPDAWKPPQQNEQPDDKADPQIKRCPRCGAPNPKASLFCAHCGQPLSEENQPPYGNPFPHQAPRDQNVQNGFPPKESNDPPEGNNYPPEYGFPGQPFPFQFDPLGGVNPNEPIDDIPAGDVAKFVQGNTQYYLPVFMNLKHFARNRFNFSAFFFQGIWLLYRKQYKIGAIIASIQGILLIAYMFLLKYFINPLYENWFAAAGIPKDNYSYSVTTVEQNNELARQFLLMPVQQRLLLISPLLVFVVAFIIMLICGFNGNMFYLKHCVKSVHKIRSETSEPTEYAIRLQQDGGLNTALAAGLGFCFIFAYLFVLML